jgi:hypothetical protein
VAILTACLPTLRPLFRRIFPWLGTDIFSGSESHPQRYGTHSRPIGGTVTTVTANQRRGRGTSAWDGERRPSFDSAAELQTGGAVEMHAWAGKKEGGRDMYAIEGSSDEELGKTDPPAKPLQIYVKQTIESKESRSPTPK